MGAGQSPEVLAEALIQQLEEGMDVRCRAAQKPPGITQPFNTVGDTDRLQNHSGNLGSPGAEMQVGEMLFTNLLLLLCFGRKCSCKLNKQDL